MKSAIGIAGDILAVEIDRVEDRYDASCIDRVGGAPHRFTASGGTYDDALTSLREAVLAARNSA